MADMAGLDIGPGLVGRKVCNPACPQWGVGTVLRVQALTETGQVVHRVSVQFAAGHRVLRVPPARLAEPAPQPERAVGWLDALAGNTLAERLWRLPPAVTEFLGTPAQRLAVLAELYGYADQPAALTRWAQRQSGLADPLSHWTRDELLVAFGRFCSERDAELRVTAARLVQTAGPEALDRALADLPPHVAERMRLALRRPL